MDSCPAQFEALADWRNQSNGKIESRIFQLDRAVDPEELSVTELAALWLDCLKSTRLEDLYFWRVSLEDGLNLLFSAASNGGAYNSGRHPAYGRLLMWRSVAALVDAPNGASCEEVANLAQHCTWF
jgi:hypothetical protein